MRSKFISGLYSADNEILANFIAMWDKSTISNIIKYKGFDLYDKIINKKNNDEFAQILENKKIELKEVDTNELRTMMIMQLASYFEIKLPKTLNMYSLEQIGIKIENCSIEALRKSDKAFNETSLDQMISYIFQKLFDELSTKFNDKDNEDKKEKIAKNIFETISKMPDEQQQKLKDELNVNELSEDIVMKAIATGTFGAAFATTISIAGFSAYTFATSALASMASLIGVTVPFSGYIGLTSAIAVLANPFFLISVMGFLLYVLNKRSDESIKNRLSPMIVTLISILSAKSENYLCTSEKHINNYNKIMLDFKEANEYKTEVMQNKILGLKDITLEKQSVFNLSSIPSSTLATCDSSMEFLNQPIVQTSLHDRLHSIINKSYNEYSKETNFSITSLTIGDLIYDMSRIDPLVIESVDFARKDDIADMFSFAYFSERIDIESIGNISQLKGYVAERLVAQQLQSQGYEVEFPELSNQPGYDLLVNNEPFQVKCGESESLVNTHFEKYPDIPVLVNEELGKFFINNDKVFPIEGVRNDEITQLTIDNLESASEIIDYEIPLITIAIVSGKNIFSVLQNKIDIENAIGKTVEESTARIVGGLTGSQLFMLGGMIWMPAAAVVGGAVGAVLGSITITKLVDKLKLMSLLKEETKAIDEAIKVIMNKSIIIAEKNLKIAEKKFYQTITILKEKEEENIIKYIEYRYNQEYKYRIEKIELMKKVILTDSITLDEETSNILISAQNAIVITEQVGVHPYNIHFETSNLIDAIEQFNKAISASEITKLVKDNILESNYINTTKEKTKSIVSKIKNFINKDIINLTNDNLIEKLWKWADENNISDFEWLEIDELDDGGLWLGLPRDKDKLLSLTELYIDNNNLSAITPEINILKNLKKLNIGNNDLIELQKEIGKLINLTELTLDRNKLTKLPKEISGLINLTTLDIINNELNSIPDEIKDLMCLTHLDLSNNKLKTLPSGIGKLVNLEYLVLNDNQLTELPNEICNLTNLHYLVLNNNPNLNLTSKQEKWLEQLKANGCSVHNWQYCDEMPF
ncbi:MAG: leucine-rich repeat domain-containing protein [Arcobacteraceae bacterium]|nr:leucine-rich repeat domain-containing protein [Arcobacteraceae bacterium]